MTGIKITDVKVVGICSKHRKISDEVPRFKNGEIIEDKDICCISCNLNEKPEEFMLKNFKSERERLEKGCGKDTMDDESNEGYFCSKFNGLCSTCQAKLTQLNECEEMCKKEIDNKEFLERLSDLEHKQWVHWTKYMMKSIHDEDKFIRWEKQIKIPYSELTEEDKEKDRVFARKVLEELKQNLFGGEE